MQSFSVTELKTRLGQTTQQPVLLDVRQPEEVNICRIAGSINIPMGDIPNKLDDLDSNAETIVICHHGIRSAQVAGFLSQAGFSKVFNLTGGIDAWATTIDTDMTRY